MLATVLQTTAAADASPRRHPLTERQAERARLGLHDHPACTLEVVSVLRLGVHEDCHPLVRPGESNRDAVRDLDADLRHRYAGGLRKGDEEFLLRR